MPKKSNKALLAENAALKAEMLLMSASKATGNADDNSSQSSRESRDSQRSVVNEAVTKFYVLPDLVSDAISRQSESG